MQMHTYKYIYTHKIRPASAVKITDAKVDQHGLVSEASGSGTTGCAVNVAGLIGPTWRNLYHVLIYILYHVNIILRWVN